MVMMWIFEFNILIEDYEGGDNDKDNDNDDDDGDDGDDNEDDNGDDDNYRLTTPILWLSTVLRATNPCFTSWAR